MISYNKPQKTADVALFTASSPLSTPLTPFETAVKELMAEGESKNTFRSYQAAMRYWAGWVELRFNRPLELPVAVSVVAQFIVDHAERSSGPNLVTEMPPEVEAALMARGLKSKAGAPSLSTLVHRISVLAAAHKFEGHPSPTQDSYIKMLLGRVRRGYAKRGYSVEKAPALTMDLLEPILDGCDDSLLGVRDKALLLFAWGTGGRRRSEVAQALFSNLRQTSPGSYVYNLRHSKTNQEGEDLASNQKPLAGKVAAAMTNWLQASCIQGGFLFRRVLRGGHLSEHGLSENAVGEIVKKRAMQAGLDPSFSAHSIRSGFITEASKQDIPLMEAMAMSGHKSMAVFQGYYRPDVTGFKSATMLDSRSAQKEELPGDDKAPEPLNCLSDQQL